MRPWRSSTGAVLTKEEAEVAVVATMSQKKANKKARMIFVSFVVTKRWRRRKKSRLGGSQSTQTVMVEDCTKLQPSQI